MKTKSAEVALPGSCGSCGIHRCHFNVETRFAGVALDRTAWLLDEKWEEFDTWLHGAATCPPEIFLPRSGLAYAWGQSDGSRVHTFPWLALRRSLAFRRLGSQGPRRQQVLETFDQRLSTAYARRIPYTVNHLVIWQNFLPFLHLDKTLGGRTYDVLLWRAPRHELHRMLGEAQERYPESPTLRDFRSSGFLAEAEQAALAGARQIVTPHAQLARLYPDKTTLLEWTRPAAESTLPPGRRLAFLGPTLGRRGAYVVREALRQLDLPFLVLGKNLEEPGFWRGLRVEERPFSPEALDEVGLLVTPAITEFKPRLILKALARGIPVIATERCGLPPQPGLHLVDPYDAGALARKIASISSMDTIP